MNVSLRWRWVLAFGVAALLAACVVWAAPQKAEEAPQEPKAQAAGEPAAPRQEPKVLARVEGETITEEDLNNFLQSLGPQAMMMYGSEEGRQFILNELVSIYLFALEGTRTKLDEAPEFKAALEFFRRRMLAQSVMRDAIKDLNVTDEDAKKFYDENQEQFMQPERVHASHILISDDAASVDVIAKVQADLKAGASFDEVAKAVSICPSAPQGGDLGEFGKGQMVPEFETAAFALKEPGDISEPVQTRFGWHIIRLEGRTPAALVPFEQVKPQILQEVEGNKISELLKARRTELEKSYKVEIVAPVSGDQAGGAQ